MGRYSSDRTPRESPASAALGYLFIVILAALTVAWGVTLVAGTSWVIAHFEHLVHLYAP